MLSYLLLPFSTKFIHVLFYQITTALGDSFTYPSVHSLQADFTTREIRGRVLAMLTVLRNIAVIPSSAILGFVYELNPRFTFFSVAGMDVIILALVLLFLQEPRRHDT
jgi:MFS family permease